MKLIYRKLDRLIVGTIQPPQSEVREVQNICQSELKGLPSDYVLVDVPSKTSTQDYKVEADGTVTLQPKAPVLRTQEQRRLDRIESTLGLPPLP
jgi:NAD(P)H-hydrate repair Nnr-like enzyme with NAD(P)H-hydrate epimerase domain